ncbi:hypothetical protein AMJ83_11210 [candidate division WOR_3 bacterium SM23_42]|uniref:Secretion system C-terminal sorting domain-containing protein n=1 Tax=candidate division WOR_3 bacterium SM23_42 TaxID=1703779 RepID=A0A0S8FSF5_UNCW3|nr:MAG: hypothetical protein AMJ83_11210 [candidate division WOR_3 bacterium SM23_42]
MCNLYRRIMFVTIALILAIGSIYAQQEFPLCAYWAPERDYFDRAVELGLNRLHYPGGDNASWPNRNDQIDALNEARELGLKIVLARAASQYPGFTNCLEYYCAFFWTNWEVDSSNFEQGVGFHVEDGQAQDEDAWKASYEMDPGMMVKGPVRPVQCRRGPPYANYFTVRIPLKIGQYIPGRRVCRLKIFDHFYEPAYVVRDETITCDDFGGTGEYYDFVYAVPIHYNCRLSYEIYYCGNVDLWCDFIETKCDDIDDLILWDVYKDEILDIIAAYKEHPALDRFYLLDEPDIGHFAANRYVMDTIKAYTDEKTIQTIWHRGDSTLYENYIDSVKANDLLIDYYPIRDYTPFSGPQFQLDLDLMCQALRWGRAVAKQNSIPLSFICQAFGCYNTPNPRPENEYDCKYNRLPTYSELRCMVWLALAYGAKGIWYFIYETVETHLGSGWYWCGLLNMDGSPREPIWSAAKSMHYILRNETQGGIGDVLLGLTSGTAFASYDIPTSSYIAYVSDDDTMQIGIFHDDNQEIEYFMMVNRHCWPEEPDPPRQVTIGIDRTNIYLKDVYTDEIIEPNYGPGDPLIFDIEFEPGQGRLFEIMHDRRGGPQSFDNPALPNTTALCQIVPSHITGSVDIEYALAQHTHVRLEVLNTLGQKMEGLVDAVGGPGYYSTTWLCGHSIPNGVYFLRFETDDIVEVEKIVLVR